MRQTTLPTKFSGESKISHQIQERRLHRLHMLPKLELIALSKVEALVEECISVIDESTDVDHAGVSSADMALTIPKRMGSPHQNLKTRCTLPPADVIRVGLVPTVA
jgi:hypothetical protein